MVIFEFLESDLEIVRVSDMIGGRLDQTKSLLPTAMKPCLLFLM